MFHIRSYFLPKQRHVFARFQRPFIHIINVKSNNCFLFHVLQVILTNLRVCIELAGSQQTENM